MWRATNWMKYFIFSFAIFLFAGSKSYASEVTYSNTTPLAYGSTSPCASPLTGTITVGDSFTITDVKVRFIATHPWRTDTNLSIISPNGTTVDLLTGAYGANLDNYNVTFDDDAAIVVDTGTHAVNQPFTGPGVDVRSEGEPLSDFDGENAQGTWTYSVCDVFTGSDDGTVLEVGLIFTVFPNINAGKSVAIYPPDQYFLPGADVIYTINVTNSGVGTVDTDAMFLVDVVPSEVTFYNGDMDDAGAGTTTPILFAESGSGLTLNYPADVGYSNAVTKPTSMAACSYNPAGGYDSAVTYICFNPKGEFQGGSPSPAFSVSF